MTDFAVLGGGALGMLVAGRLAASGSRVAIWTRTQEQAAIITANGITVENFEPHTDRVVPVHALPIGDVPAGFSGNVLITVKQTALTRSLTEFLAGTVAEQAAITMFQNGIGHLETMAAALPGRPLFGAVTTEGALRTGLSSVRHAGKGETWIGEASASGAELSSVVFSVRETLVQALKQAGFSVFVSNSIRERMLRKLLINAVINPLTALWRIPNGELPVTAERRAVMEHLLRETANVLGLSGMDGREISELWDDVLAVCSSTSGNRSSMLQDVLAGRETEIEALNGAVCRLAESEGIQSPWNTAVTALVKAIPSPEEREV